MKQYYFILLYLLLFNGCSKNSINWFEGNLDIARDTANGKLIMVDFYTDW